MKWKLKRKVTEERDDYISSEILGESQDPHSWPHVYYSREEENEDILVHIVPRTQAYQWVVEGKIDNVIAVIGLQWLELNYKRYQ